MLKTIQPGQKFKWYSRIDRKRLYRKDKALIIEDYIANEKTIKQLAKEWGTTQIAIQTIIELYYKKPDYSINIMSKV